MEPCPANVQHASRDATPAVLTRKTRAPQMPRKCIKTLQVVGFSLGPNSWSAASLHAPALLLAVVVRVASASAELFLHEVSLMPNLAAVNGAVGRSDRAHACPIGPTCYPTWWRMAHHTLRASSFLRGHMMLNVSRPPLHEEESSTRACAPRVSSKRAAGLFSCDSILRDSPRALCDKQVAKCTVN